MTSELALGTVTLADRQSGSGPDIVWLAAGDNPGDNWRLFQTPAFDDTYRSTTYDARGVGQTTSRSEPPWTIAEHAGDVAQLIETVCAAPVFLIASRWAR
jgi:pimeloyl-ACP methyl ester carboxylesterase